MNERVQKLVSQVRMQLGRLDDSALLNEDIYLTANDIQAQIMMRTMCLEKAFIVALISGKQEYDLSSQGQLRIKEIVTSWDADLIQVPEGAWKNYHNMTGAEPIAFWLFAKKLFLAPVPQSGNETLTIYAYQMDVVNEIDADTPPEIPAYCDFCLTLGVAAQYDPKLIPLYEQQIDLLLSKMKKKSNIIRKAQGVF